MRAVLVAVGSRGDVQPYVALGAEFAARGHQVVVNTHEVFQTLVTAHGLEFAPLVGDPMEAIRSEGGQAWQASGSNPIRIARRLAAFAGDLYERSFLDVAAAAVHADVIAFSALGVAGYHVAEAMDIAAVGAWLQPLTPTRAFPSPAVPPGVGKLGASARLASHHLVQHLLWRAIRGSTNRGRVALGLDPMGTSRLRAEARQVPVLYGYSRALLPEPADWPSWVNVTGYWRLETPANWGPPAELSAFLKSGDPPVYVGFGSRWSPSAQQDAATVIAALRSSHRRGVLHRGWGSLDPDGAGDDMLVVDDIPHGWLFPRMAAVVHHGGAGTTGAAVRAGVPQVVVPSFADQFFWASVVERSGIGASVRRRRLSGPRLAAALTDVASPQVRSAAVQFGARVRAERGVVEASAHLEELVLSR